ncbi:putative oxidoreductase, short-chain dehydrogenase family, putative [Plasmodium malariae]|uniref:Putative oxidoreductase, short-chain dehydrogenase family, putative n=3 Tax=Plasmodium malariae TaxID=5858 RepID=A0A1D3SNZ1_PLAMA|nr:putative oxidoreductase, short-chain dehydrogenase family, putative [Plasmodium malariae]SCO93124.1 putative oxidoreductase, short-chain dehydrogenase family, putative [Plasmodium malariae]
MEVKNKEKSFLYIILNDPSLKRFIIFLFISGVIWFLPFYKVLTYTVLKNYSSHSSANNKIYDYGTNIIIIATYYIILRKKKVGGSINAAGMNRMMLKGKCVMVTGGYRGIGLAAVIEFLKLGCEIILACRSLQHMEVVRADLLSKFPDAKIICVQLDLGSYKSIENCANYIMSKIPKIDIIVNNAGFLNHKREYINGLESTFFINYYGHFYLIKLLYKRILLDDTLVVNLSSIAHCMLKESDVNYDFIYEKNYSGNVSSNLLYRREYNFSKLCMLYFSQQLQTRFEKEKTKACSVSINPGLVKTDLFRYEQNWFRAIPKNVIFAKSPLQGSQTILYVCLQDRDELAKGCYYSDCKVDYIRAYAKDLRKSEDLWNLSEEILLNKTKF